MKQILGFIKANKLAVVIVLITIIIAIMIVLYFNSQEKNLKNVSILPANVFPLKLGSRGAEVEVLQNYLNGKGEALVVDGIYGARTDEAVRRHFNNANEVSLGNFNQIVLGKK